jgi:hypothetical protein
LKSHFPPASGASSAWPRTASRAGEGR